MKVGRHTGVALPAGDPTQPVPALDAAALVEAVRTVTGAELVLIGRASGGEVGAAYVRRPDGLECVLSRGADAARLRTAARALAIARRVGLPVPIYLEVIDTGAGVAQLQERLAGRAPTMITAALVDQLVDLVGRLAGLLHGADWMPVPELYLDRSGPGFCVHETLAGYDERTRRLLGWVHEVGRADGSTADGADLVHLDLHPGNVLVDPAGTVTGVVDWDDAGRGDARLGLVTLLFDLEWGRVFDPRYRDLSAGAAEQLERRVLDIEVGRRRMFWAHMSLRQVDWSIRHHGSTLVEHHLDLGLAGLERFDLG